MRRGELLGLAWERVDLSRGVIRLEVTKSGRRREVPMRRAVYDVLASTPGPREGRVWRQLRVRSAFETAVVAAGLDDFRFHDCRHHFASWFVMRGGSLQALKELLGHADLKMTLRTRTSRPTTCARRSRRPKSRATPRTQDAPLRSQSSLNRASRRSRSGCTMIQGSSRHGRRLALAR